VLTAGVPPRLDSSFLVAAPSSSLLGRTWSKFWPEPFTWTYLGVAICSSAWWLEPSEPSLKCGELALESTTSCLGTLILVFILILHWSRGGIAVNRCWHDSRRFSLVASRSYWLSLKSLYSIGLAW
jgi:hypothetical protein